MNPSSTAAAAPRLFFISALRRSQKKAAHRGVALGREKAGARLLLAHLWRIPVPPFGHLTPGNPHPGSTRWAAARIERLLEEEERRRRMAWVDAARHRAHPPKSSATPAANRPVGSDAWGAAEILRVLESNENIPSPSSTAAGSTGTGPGGVGIARAWIGQRRAGIPEDELLLTPRDVLDLGISFLPVVGDAYGLASDIHTFIDDPASRTLPNYALAAVGLLPFVPSGTAKLARKVGKKLDERGEPGPDLDALGLRRVRNAYGRPGDPLTREVVLHTQERILANNPTWKHVAGGSLSEKATAGPGRRLGKHLSPPSKDGRSGSRFADLMFYDPDREKHIAFQIVRTDSRGVPLLDEQLATRDLARRGIDVYYAFPPDLDISGP